jgi:acyl-CoA thioesterase
VSQNIYKAIHARVKKEPFAEKLGMKLVDVTKGCSVVEMKLTKEMENIFGMTHGGAIFSLIDEAFETASNSHGTVAFALNMNVTYISAPRAGDTLRAEAEEVGRTARTGNYSIKVTDTKGELIAVCQALVYRKKGKLPFLGRDH